MGIKVTYTFFSLLSCFHFSLVSQVFISIHGVVSSRLFLASCIVRKNFIVLLKKAIQIRKRSEIYSMYLVPFIHCPKSYVVSLLHTHMWLEGCPNPHKMEQSWECTFLELFAHMNTKLASKKEFINGLQNY